MAESVAEQKLADKAFRSALTQPTHLRAFLRRVVPELAERLDFEQTKFLDTELPFDDWRKRRCDILAEIPYRTPEGSSDSILVCVLIEHQSSTDERMPLRTLIYSTMYWDRQWRDWESTSSPKEPFRLRPLLPIVHYADNKPWRGPRKLSELFHRENPFRDFIPQWEPLFWELAKADSEELLDSEEAFDQFLAVVRSSDAEPDEFEAILREALKHLQDRHEHQRVVLSDMLRLVFAWAMWHRPRNEKRRWKELTIQSLKEAEYREEIRNMPKSAIQELYEEAIQLGEQRGELRGEQRGELRGEQRGKLDEVRKLIIRTCRNRFGSSHSEIEETLSKEMDLERLELIFDRSITVGSWDQIVQD